MPLEANHVAPFPAAGEPRENASPAELTRRGFLRFSLLATAGLSVGGLMVGRAGAEPLIILDNAKGLVVGDPTKCVGCGRCELACTEFNDGKADPFLSRIKVFRNFNYGAAGAGQGQRDRGAWGDGLVVQDLCRQCPHPVPCATACPQDAIVLDPRTNARVVEVAKCVGCKMCQRACPWGMMTFDRDADKASKCFLCDGKPRCVEACPAAALRFLPWRDLTRTTPPRGGQFPWIPPDKAAGCLDCHK